MQPWHANVSPGRGLKWGKMIVSPSKLPTHLLSGLNEWLLYFREAEGRHSDELTNHRDKLISRTSRGLSLLVLQLLHMDKHNLDWQTGQLMNHTVTELTHRLNTLQARFQTPNVLLQLCHTGEAERHVTVISSCIQHNQWNNSFFLWTFGFRCRFNWNKFLRNSLVERCYQVLYHPSVAVQYLYDSYTSF